MALIMIVFMIALASAVLVSLSESTYVAMRLNSAAEQRIKAEYILKSAVNVARFLIQNDPTSGYDDPTLDAWMAFSEGREVPGSLLGLPDPNVRVSLLIAATNAKLPITEVGKKTGANTSAWRQTLLSLLKTLGFDQPLPMNESRDGSPLPDSEQLVANLIDFIDDDSDSFLPDAIITKPGIEAELPSGQIFPNRPFMSLANELPGVPGFTPARIQKLLPFITDRATTGININAASSEVISSYFKDDPSAASKIESCKNPAQGGGPIVNEQDLTTRCVIAPPVNLIEYNAKNFDVIAKVEYGTASFMATAQLKLAGAGAPGKAPVIESLQLY